MLLLGRLNNMRYLFFFSLILFISSSNANTSLAVSSPPALISNEFDNLMTQPLKSPNLVSDSFQSLLRSPITSSNIAETALTAPSATVGDSLFGDLLAKPLYSALITGAALIPQLNPYLRVGVSLAGVLLNTPTNQLFLTSVNGGPVPQGWTGPNSPPSTSSPSSNLNFTVSTVCGTYTGNSAGAACAVGVGVIAGVPGECGNFTVSSAGGNQCNWTYNPNGNHGIFGVPAPIVQSSCGPGYVINASGGCMLDEGSFHGYVPYPNSLPPAIEATNTGSQWQLNPRNNPTEGYTTSVPTSPTLTESGTDPSTNQPYNISVTPSPNGGLVVDSGYQYTDPSGNPAVVASTITTDKSNVISSVVNNTYPNTTLPRFLVQQSTGTLPSGYPTPTNLPQLPLSPYVAKNPYSNLPLPTSPPPSSGTSPIPNVAPGAIPVPSTTNNDKPSVGSCDCSLDLFAPVAPSFLDSLKNLWNGINSIPLIQALSFSFTGSGSCPALTYNFSSAGLFSRLGVISTSIHCQILANNQNVILIFSMAAYCITAIFIFLDT